MQKIAFSKVFENRLNQKLVRRMWQSGHVNKLGYDQKSRLRHSFCLKFVYVLLISGLVFRILKAVKKFFMKQYGLSKH